MADSRAITVHVLYSPAARVVHEWRLALSPGATVQQAVRASGLSRLASEAELSRLAVGVWGRRARAEQVLADGDRVEIYRPLRVDPKLARRERFRRQGARAAGLFARRKDVPGPS